MTVRTVAAGAAALGVGMLVMSTVPNVVLAAVIAAAVGGASVAYMTATTALAQIRTDPHMIGRVLALKTVLLIGTTPIGGPLLGAISDAVGARAPLVIGGVAAIGAAAVGLFVMRRAGACSAGGPVASPGESPRGPIEPLSGATGAA